MSGRGRPKGENNKTKICSIRLEDATLRRLEAYCLKMNVMKSEAVRDAIELLVDNEQKNNEQQ